MKKQELLRRIERLEEQVRELQARPVVYPAPIVVAPAPVVTPQWQLPTIWCGASGHQQ
jgi:hypothetical protein